MAALASPEASTMLATKGCKEWESQCTDAYKEGAGLQGSLLSNSLLDFNKNDSLYTYL